MSETVTLKQKLADLRAHIAGLQLKKTGWNAHAQFAYYELGDFMPATLEKMAELQIIGLTDFKEKDFASLAIYDTETDEEPIMFYIEKATAEIQGAQRIQNIGGEHTFQRKYLWFDALELSEPDSIDPVTGKKTIPVQGQQESVWLTPQQINDIIALNTVEEIDAAVKKYTDAGKRMGEKKLKQIAERKAALSKPAKSKPVTTEQIKELLAMTDAVLLKDKKDKLIKQGYKFSKEEGDEITAYYKKLNTKPAKE